MKSGTPTSILLPKFAGASSATRGIRVLFALKRSRYRHVSRCLRDPSSRCQFAGHRERVRKCCFSHLPPAKLIPLRRFGRHPREILANSRLGRRLVPELLHFLAGRLLAALCRSRLSRAQISISIPRARARARVFLAFHLPRPRATPRGQRRIIDSAAHPCDDG